MDWPISLLFFPVRLHKTLTLHCYTPLMEQALTATPDYASAAYAKDVTRRLTALQNAHRLVIHQWEYYGDYLYPQKLQSQLNAAPAEMLSARLANGAAAEFSSTLLPSIQSQKSVVPYEVYTTLIPDLGYLFSLDQSAANPAMVTRVSHGNLVSGNGAHNKSLHLSLEQGTPAALRALYDAYKDKPTDRFRHAVSMHPEYTARQLDALGNELDALPKEGRSQLLHNEVIAALSAPHVAAISIPLYDNGKPGNSSDYYRSFEYLPKDARQALRELSGALSGLQHLQHGIDLPVVFYHVSQPHAGEVTFFAQGKEMLTEKALAALRTLENIQLFQNAASSLGVDKLEAAVTEALGIDPRKPIDMQKISTDLPVRHAHSVDHQGTGLSSSRRQDNRVTPGRT